jgi:hypothetical protein
MTDSRVRRVVNKGIIADVSRLFREGIDFELNRGNYFVRIMKLAGLSAGFR